MRSNWRSNRLLFFVVSIMISLGLIVASSAGLLTPLEEVLSPPLNYVSSIFNRIATSINTVSEDLAEMQILQERIADLERQLVRQQSELIQLREVASDYLRLANILDYTTNIEGQEFVTADVVGVDQTSFVRSIVINRGTRDGLDVGMPVVAARRDELGAEEEEVTQLGLIGRIVDVTANASKVLLITDQSSAVSAQLQPSRLKGSVVGLLTGNLRMLFLPLGEEIEVGNLAITSGLGGNFPPNIAIGQVTSVRQFEQELFQEAEIRSFVDFNNLEFVMVITSFEPIDISTFETEDEQ